jgi:Protein of unknown function (DUF1595)/Protein of unknown function (DUF1587)
MRPDLESSLQLASLVFLFSLTACEGKFTGFTSPKPVGSDPTANQPSATVDQPEAPTPCTPSTASDPMPMRRLTHAEYDNTVQALLGSRSNLALPPDEKTGLFLSNVSGSVTWSMLEQYGLSAEALTTDLAVVRASVESCNAQTDGETVCAERFVDQFGRRSFRRTLTVEERDRYRALYSAHRARGSFDDGIRMVARDSSVAEFHIPLR